MQDLCSTDPAQEYALEHARDTAATRRHELEQTTDYTYRKYICPEQQTPSGNRPSVQAVQASLRTDIGVLNISV